MSWEHLTTEEERMLNRMQAGSASLVNDTLDLLVKRNATALELESLAEILRNRAAQMRASEQGIRFVPPPWAES